MVRLENMLAVEKREGVSLDFLGDLVWSTISEMAVSRGDLAVDLTAAGLPLSFLPKPISPRDAFRRAVKEAEVRRIEVGKGVYENLLAREVSQDKNEMVVRLVRETVDSQNVRLSYDEVAEFKLTGEVIYTDDFTNVGQQASPSVRAAIDRARSAFETGKTCYSSRLVREVVTDILASCRPVSVRPSGGVYFVPKAHGETVAALQTFVERLGRYSTSGSRSVLRAIPLVDASDQRDMISQSLEEQVSDESARLLTEMAGYIKDGKVTTTVARRYAERVRTLGKMVSEYKDLLETRSDKAEADVELAAAEAMKLLEIVNGDSEGAGD